MRKAIGFIFPILLFLFAVYSAYLVGRVADIKGAARDNHLVLLAEQFSKGSVFLSPLGLPHGDYVDYRERQSLYFGPFSSVVLVPFAAVFGRTFPQVSLGLTALALSFLAVFLIARRLKFNTQDCLWLALFFSFSTVLFSVSVVNLSAYQVQALGAALVLLAILEFLGKRRYLIVGVLLAVAGMTRLTLYLSVVFFLLAVLKEKGRSRKIFLLLVPIVVSLLLLGAYNYKRFRSPLESGYRYNVTANFYPMAANLRFGLFSFSHLPANLYALFGRSPDPIVEEGGGFVMKFPYLKVDPWGIAIWFTSPLFVLLFRLKRYEYTFPALMTSLVLALPSLFYFGVGYTQFGYRYALDFLPFLFLALVPNLLPRLSSLAKALIALGIIFNGLYMASIWGYYPHFGIY